MFYSENYLKKLDSIATQIRIKSLEIICKRGAGHPGGSLSATDIITALYFSKLKIDPKNPNIKERDRFILSKGHASAALYCALALRGFFPEEDLYKWGELDCHLQGHPDRNKTNGVECCTGILGQGISVGIGMLLADRFNNLNYRVYVLIGDGECQSGVIWEGAMAAAKFKLDKLTVILDYNGVQLDGTNDEIMPLEPLAEKWRAFNWEIISIDGHNMRQILEALDERDKIHGKPTIIIARTIKGKGVSFMENKSSWHGNSPNEEQLRLACMELRKKI